MAVWLLLSWNRAEGSPRLARGTASRNAQQLKASEEVLFTFDGVSGRVPESALVADSNGTLYGTAMAGSSNGDAVAFRLTPSGSGYAESTIWNFDNVSGGDQPSGLVVDSSGNLYGTTLYGGQQFDDGLVFELIPAGKTYKEEVLSTFDTFSTPSGLALDRNGTLYGTTQNGGTSGGGAVFSLVRSGSTYSFTVLYDFCQHCRRGGFPNASVMVDDAGAVYGTTQWGGAYDCGTVFQLTPSGSIYVRRALWNFRCGDGGFVPTGPLSMDSTGAIYGTTTDGGAYGEGIVFKLTPAGLHYKGRVIWSFGAGQDGRIPTSGVVLAADGALYGTTVGGGKYDNGAVFKLAPSGAGYTESVVWNFRSGRYSPGGNGPEAGLLIDKDGSLDGMTASGGAYGDGVIFKIRAP